LKLSYGDLRRNILQFFKKYLRFSYPTNFLLQFLVENNVSQKNPGPDPDSQHRKNNVEKIRMDKNISNLEAKKLSFWPEEKEPRNF
jgi:hypothetical protein